MTTISRKTLLAAMLVPVGLAWANSAPQVTNVTASQRSDSSKLVDIYYNLSDADGDSCTVWAMVSDDNGATWNLPAWSFSGNIGVGVTPGPGKHAIWDAGADAPGLTGSNIKVRVFADDGQGAAPMVIVPAGPFPFGGMGSTPNWVTLPAYWIDKYEVTNVFYCQFLNDADPNGDHWVTGMEIGRSGTVGSYTYAVVPSYDNYPVRYTNRYDAEAFAAWRSSQDGVPYRLPTEEEWEKAAAWDPVEQHYYLYGFHRDSIDSTWCNYNNYVGRSTPVGYYDGTGGRNDAKSYYGCYDMSGNVWEWTSTPSGVLRGGAWYRTATYCQCAYRTTYAPSSRNDTIGFRLVLDPG